MSAVDIFQPRGVPEPIGHSSHAGRIRGDHLLFNGGQGGLNEHAELAGSRPSRLTDALSEAHR